MGGNNSKRKEENRNVLKGSFKKELFFSIWVWIGVGKVHGASAWKDDGSLFFVFLFLIANSKNASYTSICELSFTSAPDCEKLILPHIAAASAWKNRVVCLNTNVDINT